MDSRRRLLMTGKKPLYIFRQGTSTYGLPVAYKTSNVQYTSNGTLRVYRGTGSTLGIINFGLVNLAKYKKLIVDFDGHGDANTVGISHSIINSTPIISSKVDAYVQSSSSSSGRETKEITIQNSWTNNYVFIGVGGKEQQIHIYNLWLEG